MQTQTQNHTPTDPAKNFFENKLSNSKNITKRRPWPKKRRIIQAGRAHATRFWRAGTGPRTPEGKARVGQNALKTGMHNAAMKKFRNVLRRQGAYVRAVLKGTPGLDAEGVAITLALANAIIEFPCVTAGEMVKPPRSMWEAPPGRHHADP